MQRFLSVLILPLFLGAFISLGHGCGGNGDNGGGGNTDDCVVPSRSGITSCGSFSTECQAGQYCSDENFSGTCSVGCTSDNNCAGSDYCERASGEAVGVCRSCTDRNPPASGDNGGGSNGGNGGGNTGGGDAASRCRDANQELLDCEVISNTEFAAANMMCDSNDVPNSFKIAFAECVEAGSSCAQKADCAGDDDTDWF